jgi:lysyl-tRNA synthetase class I
MEPITITAIALFLAPYFHKAGEKLAEKTIEIALEKRQDIRDKFVEFFRPEFTSLNLNDNQKPEEVKALIAAKPEVAEAAQKKLESKPDFLTELEKVLSKQEGRTINTTNYFENVNTINIDQRRS